MAGFQAEKKLFREYCEEIVACAPEQVEQVLEKYTAQDYAWQGVYPFMDLSGANAVADTFWKPVKQALKSMQQRMDVFMAGADADGKIWVMSMGHFMGLYDHELLGIRTTGKMHHLQYAEWAQVKDGKIVQSAMFVDLIGFMNEAGVYPLSPETGHYFVYPGPKDHNGLLFEDAPPEKAAETMAVVDAMANDLESINGGYTTPADLLRKTWHEDMIWYGPCGVGASFTIPRYQIQHQRPFRENMSDKFGEILDGFIAEGNFACFFGQMITVHDGGWLGMTASRGKVQLRGDIDIYYVKDGKISENWCLFDIPYWLYQQGYDIFKRTASILNPQM